MQILAIRQEGTTSTGAMLFVDLETKGRFGDIEVSYQLDMQTGAVIQPAYIDGKLRRRNTSLEENTLLAEAFKYFLDKGPTGAEGYAVQTANS